MLLSAHYWTGCSMAQSAKIAAVGSDCVCVCVDGGNPFPTLPGPAGPPFTRFCTLGATGIRV